SYDGWGLSGTDEVPVYYRAQALWQADTLNLPRTYLSCLFLHSKQTRHYVIDFNRADVEVMRLAAIDFIDQLNKGVPPPADGSQAAREALKHLHSSVRAKTSVVVSQEVADEYREAYAAYSAAKKRKDAAENAVREVAGDAQIVLDPDGRRVCTRSVYEMPAHHREACVVDKLNPTRSKKGSWRGRTDHHAGRCAEQRRQSGAVPRAAHGQLQGHARPDGAGDRPRSARAPDGRADGAHHSDPGPPDTATARLHGRVAGRRGADVRAARHGARPDR